MENDEEKNCDSDIQLNKNVVADFSLSCTQETTKTDVTDSSKINANPSQGVKEIDKQVNSIQKEASFESDKDRENTPNEELESLETETQAISSQISILETEKSNKSEAQRFGNDKNEQISSIPAGSQEEKKDDSAENVLTVADTLMMSDTDNEISPIRKKQKSKTAFIHSEPEDNSNSPTKEALILKYRALVDSESEAEEATPTASERDKEVAKNGNKVARFSSLIDSESELEEGAGAPADKPSKPVKARKQKKVSALIDTDSESEDSDGARQDADIKPRDAPPKRVSAKTAMEQMSAIKSETQRLHRENYVRVPYHKPKQHTLQEFLTRKTLTRPGAVKGSNLKMSKEELEEFAKHLEERAKEATEFFKSDSGDEKEEEMVDTVGVKEEQQQATFSEDKAAISEDTLKQPAKEEEPEEEGFSLFEETRSQSVQIPEASTSSSKDNLHDVDLCPSPSLRGDPNMLIDLNTGDLISPKPTGVDNLLQRFLKNSAKRKPKAAESVNILSVESGKVEMKIVPLQLHEDSNSIDTKPGSAYTKLKNDLKLIIAKKRREELLKKVQGTNAEKEVEGKICDDDDEEDEEGLNEVEKQDIDELEEEVMEVDDNEGLIDNEADVDIGAEDEGENASEIDADDERDATDYDEEEDDDDEEPEADLDVEPKKFKSRIIAAFEDSDDETERASKAIDDILTEPLVVENEPGSQLWINEEPKNSDDESELLGLCSGRFDATQRLRLTQMTQGYGSLSSVPDSLPKNDEKQVEEGQDRASPPHGNLLLESSDDEEGNPKTTKFTQKKMKGKQRKKLGFSDDEAEDDLENVEDDIDSNPAGEDDDNEEEVVETYIDYDSEENEIEVQMNKNDRLAKAETFFEKEAELSDSEWGSADEDEKDMDKYDIELGDEDQFDKQKIRTELEQIHLREMLDEDIRDVRKMKEMFLEDEDDVGAKRQRQFKWKHSENGFSIDNPTADKLTEINPNGESDDENEVLCRKIRFERELLLMDKVENKAVESPALAAVAATSLTTTTKKITIFNKTKTQSPAGAASNGGVDSPFLITKVVNSAIRGSFLIRDEETLNKLASKASVDSDGAAGVTGKSRNFVFASLSEKEIALKRKSPDSSRDDEGANQVKKQKVSSEVGRKKRLIDHLV